MSDTPAPTTFARIVAEHARRDGRKLAVVSGRTRITYAELDARVARTAGAFTAMGASGRSVVSSQLPNGVDALVVALAANRVGAIHHQSRGRPARGTTAFVLDQADPCVVIDTPDHPALAVAVDAAADACPPAASGDRFAPRFLVYTSGSTADPNGALHSDATLLAERALCARFSSTPTR